MLIRNRNERKKEKMNNSENMKMKMKIWYYMEQRKNFRAQKFLIDFTDEVIQIKKIVFKIEHLS